MKNGKHRWYHTFAGVLLLAGWILLFPLIGVLPNTRNPD